MLEPMEMASKTDTPHLKSLNSLQDNAWGMDWRLTPADTLMLKGVAICLMLWHHLFEGARDIGGWTWWLGRHGNICVALFLFLSGYGMTAQYGKLFAQNRFGATACACWLRRYWGMFWGYWPVFAPALVVGVCVFHRGLADAYGVEGVRKWICLGLDCFAFGGYRSYNITWWFFRLIIIFYALYPFLQWATTKRQWTWALTPLLLTGMFGCLGTFCNEWILNRWLFAFMAGMFAHSMISRWNVVLSRWRGWVWMGGLMLSFAGFWIRDNWGETVDGLLAMALVVTMLPLLRHVGPIRNIGFFLGRHSMNLFMLHSFICTYFGAEWIQSFDKPWTRFTVLLASSLGISIMIETGKHCLGMDRLAKSPPFASWIHQHQV